MYEFKPGDDCMYRYYEAWSERDHEWLWHLVRVRVLRVTPRRATVRLVDFPQWRARNVPISKLVL
ncbi:MAG TPA: hypothetical protein VF916_09935 [Ktedonobacterales bacterium]